MPQGIQIAIAGHPGTGKTSLAVVLRTLAVDAETFVDLPGAHSLIPRTEADRQVYDSWFRPPDSLPPSHIIVVIDTSKIREQLSFLSQLIDLHRPVVVVLRETQRALRRGISVRVDKLSALMGVTVVPSREQTENEASAILDAVRQSDSSTDALAAPHWRPTRSLADAFNGVNRSWLSRHQPDETLRLIEGLRLLTVPDALNEYQDREQFRVLDRAVREGRRKLEISGENWTMSEISQRHAWLTNICRQCITIGDPEMPDPAKVETRSSWFGRWKRTPQ